jgi:hypothetical protein
VLDPARSAACVDDHGDHVEANRARVRSRMTAVGEPRRRKSAQAPALTETEPEQRILIGPDRPPMAYAARLDLDEHKRPSIARDQVYLAVSRAHVTREHGVAMALEPSSGEELASRAQRAPSVFAHCRDATARL